MTWDHAGGMLLFEEAGGKITDLDGKDINLSCGKNISENFGFVAAPSNVHAEIREASRQIMRDMGRQDLLGR
jgi:3'(2'), 5'-bisphosphate nucleotidase